MSTKKPIYSIETIIDSNEHSGNLVPKSQIRINKDINGKKEVYLFYSGSINNQNKTILLKSAEKKMQELKANYVS